MAADRIPDSTADLYDVDASCRVAGRFWKHDGTKVVGAASATDVAVRLNGGADVGPQPRINLHEGSGVTLEVADDPTNAEVDITFTVDLDAGYF